MDIEKLLLLFESFRFGLYSDGQCVVGNIGISSLTTSSIIQASSRTAAEKHEKSK
ncbi:hypothetical protein HanIR_Chr14g0678581 [Helianthus annuus]|nr:hypothetical protein HanIR_Chr14g0678581 [Helianthus annuus]